MRFLSKVPKAVRVQLPLLKLIFPKISIPPPPISSKKNSTFLKKDSYSNPRPQILGNFFSGRYFTGEISHPHPSPIAKHVKLWYNRDWFLFPLSGLGMATGERMKIRDC